MAHDVPDAAIADRNLQEVESAGRSAAESLNIPLAAVERWRWDEPTVSFQWVDAVGMWRSVSARYSARNESIELEGSAWVDRDVGLGRERLWHHRSFDRMTVPVAVRHFPSVFRDVAGWDVSTLDRVEQSWDGREQSE